MEIITNNQLLHKGQGQQQLHTINKYKGNGQKSKYKVEHVEQLHGKNDNNSIKTLPLIH